MLREISSGGVVVRETAEGWEVAVIEPQKTPGAVPKKSSPKIVLALPKGLVDEGEKPEQTALREVFEETGVRASVLRKLADIKYVYVRTWADHQRVFKIVSFYLLHYESGTIGEIAPAMQVEVKRAFWMPLAEAARRLSYRGERAVLEQARQQLQARPA
jgi:8-oxo-dGTP pyrophosphatase MutT (NUDIX family)